MERLRGAGYDSGHAGDAIAWRLLCIASGDAVMTPNGLGQFGNMGRNIFRDSGFKSFDFSVFKNFTFKERYGVQFRAEFFNVLNHPIAANPYGASSNFNSKQRSFLALGFRRHRAARLTSLPEITSSAQEPTGISNSV